MRIWSVEITQTRRKLLRVPAASAMQARQSAEVLLRPGDKLGAVTEYRDTTAASGRSALDHLLAREYLDQDGVAMLVEDWLQAIRSPEKLPDANRLLAMAGLRLNAETARVVIASPASIPLLHHWFVDTPWEGSNLTRTLAALPGAGRVNLTYAGTRSRAVSLPVAVVMPQEGPL